eukprot:gb/GECH01014320.1/.p1 GENE.gb/GECH01014320.1/~~gb/GECH01014320.1/.p1  ORF type:complete len:382 (+),score=107.41 gb/GECH01014320.1/:1-1146(+)
MDSNTAIVIDNGTSTLKIGFGGEEQPAALVPTYVGVQRGLENNKKGTVYCGKEGLKKIKENQSLDEIITLQQPIQNGAVKDWAAMEDLWDHCYDVLGVNQQQHPLMMTANAYSAISDRRKMTEMMFETFGVPQFYVAVPGYLSLYASGDNTGIVVESGDGCTNIVPVSDGILIPSQIQQFPVTGRHITDYLLNLLVRERGYMFAPAQERKIARRIKHTMCYASDSYADDLIGLKKSPQSFEQDLELHTGENVVLSGECFKSVEPYFQPGILGMEGDGGLAGAVYNCINNSDQSIRKFLYGNIVLGGDSLQFPGMAERLNIDMLRYTEKHTGNVDVHVHEANQYSAWKGGSILSCLPEVESAWISKKDYEEEGSRIVQRKCF